MIRKPWLKKIINFEYSKPPDKQIPISEQDLLDQLVGQKSSTLFLGLFTVEQLKGFFEEVNIFEELKQKGVWPVEIEIISPEQFSYYLKVTLESGELVGEILMREGVFTPKEQYISEVTIGSKNLLFVEWLCLQNPLRKFNPNFLPLPGQRHPGLGVGRKVADLLERACRRVGADGLLNFPEFFHNAYLYIERYHFYNPRKEAEFIAIKRDLCELSFVEIAWAVFSECVYYDHGKLYRWRPEALMWPCDEELVAYFESRGWREQVQNWSEVFKFTVDKDKLNKVIEKLKDEVSRDCYTPAV